MPVQSILSAFPAFRFGPTWRIFFPSMRTSAFSNSPSIGSAKRKIRGILWHADCSKVLAASIDDLNSGTRGYVQPALGVYRHAISSAPQRSIGTRLRVVQLHERPPVLSGTVWLDVER